MNRWLARLLLFASLLLPLAPVAAEVRMEINTFLPSLDFGLSHRGQEETRRFDIKAGLGIEDTTAFETRVHLNDHIRLSYVDLQYAGKKNVLDSERFGLALASDFRLEYGGVAFSQPLVGGENWKLEGQFDIKGYRFAGAASAVLQEREIASTQKARAAGVAPTVGLALSADPSEHFHLYGEASVLPLGTLGSLWDFDAGVKYRVKDRTFLHLGYRRIEVESVDPAIDTALDARIGGPYFGLNYDF